MAKQGKQDLMERTIKRKLTFQLNEEEFSKKGKQAAKLGAELWKLEAEFARVKKEWGDKIKAKTEALNSILKVIDAGEEEREVECVEQRDFTKNAIRYVYEGRVFNERAMSEAEKQLDFDGVKKKKEQVKIVTKAKSKKVAHVSQAQA